jgi:hypothetical protein
MDAPRGVVSAADLVSLPALDVMGEYCARQGIERVVWPEVDAWGQPDEWRENGSSSGASFVSLLPGELSSGEPPKDPMRVGFYDRRYHGLRGTPCVKARGHPSWEGLTFHGCRERHSDAVLAEGDFAAPCSLELASESLVAVMATR